MGFTPKWARPDCKNRDPSTEVFPLVHAARRAIGHRVVSLDPEDHKAGGFNALNWIDTSSCPSISGFGSR
ncbi:MAG: type IV secretory system conjugative DNA transfer family protein [Candidatus Binataceae bacterium]|nr:type IV secretory system conjugative DNA transfer family protein [Candidatus Binataceae bacterium]